jgi:LppP/LprE lipoprotein
MLALGTLGFARAAASWLDSLPVAWNHAGAAVPAAPPLEPAVQARCRAQERAAAGPGESQVAAAGWRLETYWPTKRQGDVAVVLADVNYDGMCRPFDFNVFVFAGGQFAGTLSPVNMISRTDGVLREAPSFLPDGRIVAIFLRYAPSDPLCCPSRPPTVVTYRVDRTSAGPLVSVAEIGQFPRSGQLSASGGPKPTLPFLVIGAILVGLGWITRPRPVVDDAHSGVRTSG